VKYLNLLTLLLFSFSCAVDIPDDGKNDPPQFNSGDTLDIISWNVEQCPKNGNTTLGYLEDAILQMSPDIVAFQEMTSEVPIRSLADRLVNYDYAVGINGSSWRLAYLYNNNLITPSRAVYEILSSDSRKFPRPPLVLETSWKGENIIIINNHLKAMGDGILDETDNWDEETRRRDALLAIHDYVETNFSGERIVILGDMNDALDDDDANNVFNVFSTRPESYYLADYAIATGPTSGWSYRSGSWRSHLDHIIITDELFDAFDTTQVIPYESYLDNGWQEYDQNISDHRPISISLIFEGAE